MLRNFSAAFLLVLSACAYSTAGLPPTTGLAELSSGRSQGTEISVVGYLKSLRGRLFLYRDTASADADDFGSGVDVVFKRDERIPTLPALNGGRCVVVVGRFTAFDDDTVGTGYFRSTIGYIKATRVLVEGCEQGAKGDGSD